MQLRLLLVELDEAVDTHDRSLARFDLGLQHVGSFGDLALGKVALDRLHHPALAIDRVEIGARSLLQLVGQRLDEVRASERIDSVRHAGLEGDDLLGAKRQPGGLLGGKRQSLVVGVGVQRLGAAKHPRERLDGGTNDVQERLLGGQRDTRRLGVEAHQHRPRIARPKRVAQLVGPDPAGSAVLRDFFEEVDVGIEEERQPGRRSRPRRARGRPPPPRR